MVKDFPKLLHHKILLEIALKRMNKGHRKEENFADRFLSCSSLICFSSNPLNIASWSFSSISYGLEGCFPLSLELLSVAVQEVEEGRREKRERERATSEYSPGRLSQERTKPGLSIVEGGAGHSGFAEG